MLFYFSGHARANALNLGSEELPLTALRDRLRAVPSTITIVVLDACQSGSFSRVKGAAPAADFSYNSVSGLTQKGLAVMASSTAEELSQESDELKASYFTHHLVTALRGAGDSDGDGRVSLDEAYRYAYRRTLASTARTQVGEQHVTLETDLAGQGEIPVTYPAEARAQLDLPASLEARVLVQQRPSGAVMADVQKVPGAAVRLALVAGRVRRGRGAQRARSSSAASPSPTIASRSSTLDTLQPGRPRCDRRQGRPRQARRAARGRGSRTRAARTGSLGHRGGARLHRAQDRRVHRPPQRVRLPAGQPRSPDGAVTLGASRILTPHLAGVLQAGTLAGDSYQRSIGGETDTASFHSYGGALYLRAFADVTAWLGVYGQAGAGVGLGVVDLETQQTGVPPKTSDTSFGYLLSGGVGRRRACRTSSRSSCRAGTTTRRRSMTSSATRTTAAGSPPWLGVRIRLGDER